MAEVQGGATPAVDSPLEYRLFVDDSGNREYSPDRQYGVSGKSRHFVYGSLLMDAREAPRLTERLQGIKLETFGSAAVELKSNWLRIPHERERRYRRPFGISDAQLTRFVDSVYEALNAADLMLIAVVVDKLHMQEQYPDPWYAPTVAYDVLLQRAVLAVPAGATLNVRVDDISGKTPKQSDYKTLLAKHHERLQARGSPLQRDLSFACLGSVRFVNSAHSDLIQAADIVAYNVLRQFREHGDAWELATAKLPTYEYFQRLSGKFRKADYGRIQGFGVVKFPMRQRVRWVYRPQS